MPATPHAWARTCVEQSDLPPALRKRALRELDAYFSGTSRALFSPLPLRGTAFQRSVWRALLRIPFGETMTYGQVAERIGHPRAARAVGNAVKKNPLPILIPCHRVVPAAGGVGQFAGGSAKKRWLLRYERTR